MKRMLLKIGRSLIGYDFVLPWVIAVYVLRPFYGRQHAIQRVGKVFTRFTARLTGKLLPQIGTPDQFDMFKQQAERIFRAMAPLYDLEVIADHPDAIGIHVHHCPVATAFRQMGLPEMGKYACACDWVQAQKNAAVWDFSRAHSLSTDGQCCNQTYFRKTCNG